MHYSPSPRGCWRSKSSSDWGADSSPPSILRRNTTRRVSQCLQQKGEPEAAQLVSKAQCREGGGIKEDEWSRFGAGIILRSWGQTLTPSAALEEPGRWNLGCFHQKWGWGFPASRQASKMEKARSNLWHFCSCEHSQADTDLQEHESTSLRWTYWAVVRRREDSWAQSPISLLPGKD